MTRRPKNPSDDFNIGYEVGWTASAPDSETSSTTSSRR